VREFGWEKGRGKVRKNGIKGEKMRGRKGGEGRNEEKKAERKEVTGKKGRK